MNNEQSSIPWKEAAKKETAKNLLDDPRDQGAAPSDWLLGASMSASRSTSSGHGPGTTLIIARQLVLPGKKVLENAFVSLRDGKISTISTGRFRI
jgi:hypothetical protein